MTRTFIVKVENSLRDVCPINEKHLLKGYFPPPDDCPLEPYREDGAG